MEVVRVTGGIVGDYYQVGGENGRFFSTRRAAENFANRNRIVVGELDTLPVMRKGRVVSRRRMTLKELASNSTFKNLKVGDRVEVYGIEYTVNGLGLYGNKDIISLRSVYNDITSEIRERFVIGRGRKL
jgi:hypothetical protein